MDSVKLSEDGADGEENRRCPLPPIPIVLLTLDKGSLRNATPKIAHTDSTTTLMYCSFEVVYMFTIIYCTEMGTTLLS